MAVNGTGTTNTIAKWTNSTTIGDSSITDDGTTTTVSDDLAVDGTLNPSADTQFGGNIYLPNPGGGCYTESADSDSGSNTFSGGAIGNNSAALVEYGYAASSNAGCAVQTLGEAESPFFQIYSLNNSQYVAQFNDDGSWHMTDTGYLCTTTDSGNLTFVAGATAFTGGASVQIFGPSSTCNVLVNLGNSSTAAAIIQNHSSTHVATFRTDGSWNICTTTAPSSPASGDIWFDGTNLKMRVGSTTKTFTLT